MQEPLILHIAVMDAGQYLLHLRGLHLLGVPSTELIIEPIGSEVDHITFGQEGGMGPEGDLDRVVTNGLLAGCRLSMAG